MDTSKEYQKMCEQNDTQHKKIHTVDKQFLLMFNAARYEHPADFKNFDITKDRQDQLQEMFNPYLYFFGLEWGDGEYEMVYSNPDKKEFKVTGKTMEQLWLAFVMQEKYQKRWDNEKQAWVKREAGQ